MILSGTSQRSTACRTCDVTTLIRLSCDVFAVLFSGRECGPDPGAAADQRADSQGGQQVGVSHLSQGVHDQDQCAAARQIRPLPVQEQIRMLVL